MRKTPRIPAGTPRLRACANSNSCSAVRPRNSCSAFVRPTLTCPPNSRSSVWSWRLRDTTARQARSKTPWGLPPGSSPPPPPKQAWKHARPFGMAIQKLSSGSSQWPNQRSGFPGRSDRTIRGPRLGVNVSMERTAKGLANGMPVMIAASSLHPASGCALGFGTPLGLDRTVQCHLHLDPL